MVWKKSYSISRKSTDFGHFWLPRSTFKADFLNVQAKIEKLESLLQEVVRNIMLNFEPSISSDLRGVAVLQNGIFQKTVILANCNFVGRPVASGV